MFWNPDVLDDDTWNYLPFFWLNLMILVSFDFWNKIYASGLPCISWSAWNTTTEVSIAADSLAPCSELTHNWLISFPKDPSSLFTWNCNDKNAPLESILPHCGTASTKTTIPLWKREQCHFESLTFQIFPFYTISHNQRLRQLATKGGYICKSNIKNAPL